MLPNPLYNFYPNTVCPCGSQKKFKYCCKDSMPKFLPERVVWAINDEKTTEGKMFIVIEVMRHQAINMAKEYNKIFSWVNTKRRFKQLLCKHEKYKKVAPNVFQCNSCEKIRRV